MRSSSVRWIIPTMAMLLGILHGSLFIENSPGQIADATIAEMLSKGMQMPEAQRLQLHDDIYSTMAINRTVDCILAVLTLGVAVFFLRARLGLAAAAAALYAILNCLFLLLTWNALEHGISEMATSFVARTALLIHQGSIWEFASQVVRPTTFVLGIGLTSTLLGMIVMRRSRGDGPLPRGGA